MGEEFYSTIKLISGEEIFALISVDNTGDSPVIIMQNPLVMKMVNSPKGGLIKVRKWMELTEDDMFVLTYDKILTMSECKDDKIIGIYNNYLQDELGEEIINTYQPSGKVKPTSKMGYISSVEDARKIFEELFKINQEPKES